MLRLFPRPSTNEQLAVRTAFYTVIVPKSAITDSHALVNKVAELNRMLTVGPYEPDRLHGQRTSATRRLGLYVPSKTRLRKDWRSIVAPLA